MENAVMGILIPFVGTSLGAACVYAMKQELDRPGPAGADGVCVGRHDCRIHLEPLDPGYGRIGAVREIRFVPAVAGFWLGIFLLLALDRLVPHLHMYSEKAEGPHSHLQRTTMLVLAVTLHNIPEGMAVGVVYAGLLAGQTGISAAGAFALSLGIALQNLPEGAIISMPLKAAGVGKHKAFLGGLLSGIVEPLGAAMTIALTAFIVPILPYLLSLAAGAMCYVVVEELIPECQPANIPTSASCPLPWDSR